MLSLKKPEDADLNAIGLTEAGERVVIEPDPVVS